MVAAGAAAAPAPTPAPTPTLPASDVGYTVGELGFASPGFAGNTTDFTNQTLTAGRLVLPIHSDYQRYPDRVLVKRTGQPDIVLTGTTFSNDLNLWQGDIPVTATDYTIRLERDANGLLNQSILPVVLTGANPVPTQVEYESIIQGNDPPFTMAATLIRPVNGLALKLFRTRSPIEPTHSDADGGAQVFTGTYTDFDAQINRLSLSVLPATVRPASNFTPQGGGHLLALAFRAANA